MPAATKTWHLLPHNPVAIQRLATELQLSPIVAQLLLNRGLSDGALARRFLDAPLSGLHQPHLLPGVTEAADLLLAAVREGRRICVYGDYDVDGTTGTALLLQALRLVGAANVDFYVPHRLEEGYGLNVEALRQIAASGTQVVVTVDCGIASLVEADEARRLGLALIVTDHHEFKDRLPASDVLVHPRLGNQAYPFGQLSGSAVAFKLAWALCQKVCGSEKVTQRFRDYLLNAVALVALGTVADVVSLHDENRIFVLHGLNRLRQAPPPGLKALIEASGLNNKSSLRALDVGYKLAPRINAVGRLGCARLVVELLTTTSPQRAVDLARYLDGQNAQRQALERRMLTEARELLAGADLDTAPALVLASEAWHAGILGIVAARLAEMYARPALLIALRPDGAGSSVGQGSGRSVPGFPLHEALKACEDHLLAHGGHQAAAGFKLRPECIDAFRESFFAYVERRFPTGPPLPRLVLDAEVPLSSLTFGLLRDLDRLEPYGMHNDRPRFLAGDVQVVGSPRRVGAGDRHLRFQVRQNGTSLWTIGFGLGERCDELMSDGGRCCLAFTPQLNEWQGQRSVQLEVHDFQAGPRARLGSTPTV
jgi:single-stranded-DNA-specific exonuclease